MKRITLSLQSPYVGLRPFSEREAVLFFRREQHVRDLLGKLEGQQRFIAVLGASGTGKSSLVRAGLVPALHRGALMSAGPSWNVCIFTPGDAPLTNLATELIKHPGWSEGEQPADAVASLSASLARSPLALTELYRQKASASGGQALLLVVDQFEEIFRYRQKNVDEAESFINLLLRSATEDVPMYVVMTMRSDFLGNYVTFHGLPEAINRGIYLTPRLGPDQLKSIIASPLALVGGEINPVLVSKLVNSLGGEDELPIMEHALLRMWNRARAAGRTSIEAEDFEAVCALHGERMGQARLAYTIDNHASEIYDTLSPHQQVIARQVFLSLVERRDGREVRRPQTVKQLVELVGEQERENLLAVIEAFRAEEVGFLLPPMSMRLDDDYDRMIDISHESLFRQWQLFRQWLDEEEVDVTELKEWQQRTARQIEGGSWLDEYDGGRAARWRERVKARGNPEVWVKRYRGPVHYREVNRYIEASLARVQRAKAEQERIERAAKEGEIRRLELEAQVQREAAERAEADRLQAEKEKKQAQEYAESSRRKTRIAIAVGGIAVLFFLVAALTAWWANQERGRADKERKSAEEAKAVAEHALNSAEETKKRAEAEKARAETQTVEAEYQRRLADEQKQAAIVQKGVAERQKVIATEQTARAETMAREAFSGELAAKAESLSKEFPDQSALLALAGWQISPTGKAQALVRVLEGKYSGQTVLREHVGGVHRAAFAPNGKTVVTASRDTTARLWDVASGKELHVLREHVGGVSSAAFAPDGKTVVTASGDKTARLWDVASGKELHVLRGHENWVNSAAFAPDGKTVVTASGDNTARLWRCEVCRPIDEIAAKLRKTIGRDLTDDERRRYGVPDSVLATKE